MRYATVLIRWNDTELMPVNSAIAAEPNVHLEATYYINPIGGGTYAELSQFRGDMNRAATLFETSPQVEQFAIPNTTDGITYLQYDTAPLLDELMSLLSDHAVVISWPIRSTRDTRGVQLTVFGPETVLSEFFAAFPDGVDLTLERVGDYRGDHSDPMAMLTDRQHLVLDTAVRLGYYESPRGATHEDLAEELDIALGTVAEHLQRIEATVMNSLTGPQ
ncbi:helix-turn-helix domain-containing protein [Natrarchaeobius sp. A-rgal3]|uniref:helix-turn-helix domain-containing protein n=1 Tax=Natrarchaeobius versutus TaxID=1679078 RepID=UPI0035105CC5